MSTAATQTPAPNTGAPPPAPADTAAPAAAPSPGQATPEPLPPDVEIDLGSDGAAPVVVQPPAPAAAPAATPPADGLKLKTGGRAASRIATLDQERNDLARQLEAERAEKERILQGALAVVEQKRRSDIAAFTHYENFWTEREANARAALTAAVDAGDAKLQADAMARLTEAQSHMTTARNWKAANPQAMQMPQQRQQPVAPQRQAQPPAQQQQSIELDPATETWVNANPWFNPDSDEFQPEMHQAAALYAAGLERRLVAAGRGAEVATPAYFAKVEQFIRQEFPEAFEGGEPAPAPQPMRNGGAPVAPTGRGPAPGQAPPKSSNTIRLSGAERALVKQMNSNGALPKNGQGQRMSDHEAEVYFAKQKAADMARRKES